MSLWLTRQEVDELCEPLKQPAAQMRFLRETLALTVREKPNGRPLVLRSHFENVLGGLPKKHNGRGMPNRPSAQPNVAGLQLAFSKA
jgi:hypothetical protein